MPEPSCSSPSERPPWQEAYLTACLNEILSVWRHDLRNQFGAINNAVYYLKKKLAKTAIFAEDPRVEKFLGMVGQQVESASGATTRLLDRTVGFPEPQEPLSVVELLGEVLRAVPLPGSVAFHLETEPVLPAVQGARSQIFTLLYALLKNAVEAVSAGGTIRAKVSTASSPPLESGSAEQPWLQIEILDSGGGISAEALPQIWDLFFSTRSGHAGMGLKVANNILKRLGGRVSIENVPEGWARATVLLPAASVEVPSRAGKAASVLIADDAQPYRESLGSLLRSNGYEVTEAMDGLDAVARCKEKRFDIALVDIDMPGLSGFEVVTEIRTLQPDCVSLLVTGFSTDPSHLKPTQALPFAIASKPLSPAKLVREMSRILTRPSVLVVEDDEAERQSLTAILTDLGVPCDSASSGSQALALLAAGRVDVLLLDLILPETDGTESLRRALQIRPDLDVILITGQADAMIVDKAIRLGAHCCMKKPIDPEALARAICRMRGSRLQLA